MSLYELLLAGLPLFYFMFIASITPGPNNVMLTASGMNFGYLRTLPHIFGIMAGFQVLILLCALGMGAVYKAMPQIEIVLTILGAGYLIYLAYRIATAGRVGLQDKARTTTRPLNFFEAFAFQFINPKGVVFSIAAVSILPAEMSITQICLIIFISTLINSTVSTHVWTLFGKMIASLFRNDKIRHRINIALAILLLATIPMMVM